MAVVISRRHGWSRPVSVPASLADLRGPISGRVRLPLSVYSSASEQDSDFDLDDPGELMRCYAIVMEHGTVDDVEHLLNAVLLRGCWAQMWLSPHVRRAWEPLMNGLA